MKMYLVDVKPKSIVVTLETKLSNVHYRAKIDGEIVLYQVIKSTGSFFKAPKDWFARGSQHVMYHARNLGEIVEWEDAPKLDKKVKEVSKKQKVMFS